MKKILLLVLATICLYSCKQNSAQSSSENKKFASVLDQYWEDHLRLFPLEATGIGDNRYNDQLQNDGTAEFRKQAHEFYQKYLDELSGYKRDALSENDKISFDILKDQLEMSLEAEKLHFEYIPFNQFYALTLSMAQMGSGTGIQPFKTVKDYENWLKRVSAYSVWADTAITNFRKGMKAGVVLPRSIVVKMIPQMQSMIVTDPGKSLFYGPVNAMPTNFSDADKKRLTEAYSKAILSEIVPVYKKLGDFLQNEYLPKARATSGLSALPSGKMIYTYLVKQQTTTTKTPEEIYQTGLREVARIRTQMDSIKKKVGFKGDLTAFFNYMRTDPKFYPYKTPKEVLDAFEQIHQTMLPSLITMFKNTPKTPFEIRQTEAFRAASASAEYNQGSADGSRPGIFYVPILDATKFNSTSGMESLFLHEAIPGHHYQISLTQENKSLPAFRRFGGHNAYVEGWALYCESLGKELNLYTDPYQHMGALGDEMHRAIRLVVDVAIHTKNMTREEAVKYMTDNEQISDDGAIAEIERYMVIPGQALGYKIGALKIRELRNKFEKQLGSKFNLSEFHDQILKDGSMPLSVLENKMNAWADRQE